MAESFPFRIEFPPSLPISARAGEIVDAIQANPVLVLAGETGSGKTTQIAKMCLAAGRGRNGRIACTQPRRVAALSLSRRVAEEMGVAWGREVGCKVRFQDQTSGATVVKFLTDGMLLAELQADPRLLEYDTIIIDEAHERSLNIDFLLGHLRTLRYRRPELRVVITSATIDTEAFSKAFDGAPVITVEGRTFPVEVIYAPLDSLGSEQAEGDEPTAQAEALHYVDGAMESVVRIARESTTGDVLVFMPSERDIRELSGLAEDRLPRKEWEVVPLFGRLSNSEQQRVFASAQKRKLVVATNIAETSLTIPGIAFVVDTGLARMSRYAVQSRTRRLPIEEVSQSSADQRKGRAGRVSAGVCIRLYSEADFLERPRFTSPEIQRANLADVILRMKAYHLGDIERFPFINMPAVKAVRAGYALLEELGAIAQQSGGQAVGPSGSSDTVGSDRQTARPPDRPTAAPVDGWALTEIGAELARLPVDPTVGRMILQARTEKALREVLIIAAGLSIQDPRERPLDKQQQADDAHRRFRHPDSDFLALLNLWDSAHGEFDTMSPRRLRSFCRDHFLSYTRMREWRDIHRQLLETLEGVRETQGVTGNRKPVTGSEADGEKGGMDFGTPQYRAIHRSILAGLLGNIARREEEKPGYKATHDRAVTIFPGSGLASAKNKGPRWIMAAEIAETSRLYARTCARLDPVWALDLAAHLIRVAHSEPFWDAERGRVMVKQRSRLYGLELETRAVGYGKINPRDAGEIFIREGLVEDTITWPFDFIAHNREIRETVEVELTRARDANYLNLDEAAVRFYVARLLDDPDTPPPSAVAELVDLVRERRGAEPRFLMMEPVDLRGPEEPEPDTLAYPVSVPLENRALPLSYAYKPGMPDDGVTVDVPLTEAARLREADLDWAVPGHLLQKVEYYLKALPKEARRNLVPLGETALKMAKAVADRDRLSGRRESLPEALAAELQERHRLAVTAAVWAERPLPDHLRVRIRLLDADGREIVATRDYAEIRKRIEAKARAAAEEGVTAANRTAGSFLEQQLGTELGWLERDLRDLSSLGPLISTLTPLESLKKDAFESIRAWVLRTGDLKFEISNSAATAVAARKADLRGIVPRLGDQLREILDLRQELMVLPHSYPALAAELDALIPSDFLRRTSYEQLAQFPRYLRSMKVRADRARQNPARDAERAKMVAPYAAALAKLRSEKAADAARRAAIDQFRWLLEEFRVSIFSQELGTAIPVSEAKLNRALEGLQKANTAPGRTEPKQTAGLLPTVAKPAAPLKNLKSLDQLFRKNG